MQKQVFFFSLIKVFGLPSKYNEINDCLKTSYLTLYYISQVVAVIDVVSLGTLQGNVQTKRRMEEQVIKLFLIALPRWIKKGKVSWEKGT